MNDDTQGESSRPAVPSPRSRRRTGGPPIAPIALAVVVLAAITVGWLWLRSRESRDPGPAALADSTAVDTSAAEEPFVLPTLGASDAVVRRLAEEVTSHPRLASWLVSDELIRRFVTAVVDLSRGSTPLPSLEMLIPDEPFSVQASQESLLVDPASYRRYDLLADVVASIDTEGAAEVYHRLLPLFREAYRELGVPDVEFEEVLARAMGNLLSVEVPDGPVEVREAVGRYDYVDERLQALTPAEKHVLRLGPENARRVQEKLRELSNALGLPVEPTS